MRRIGILPDEKHVGRAILEREDRAPLADYLRKSDKVKNWRSMEPPTRPRR